MRSALLFVLLAAVASAGCRRPAKKDDPPAAEPEKPSWQPAPPRGANAKGGEGDQPNFLNDPRFKKDGPAPLPAEAPTNGDKPNWGLSAPVPGVGAPPVVAAPAGVPLAPVGGAVNPTPPAFKPVSEADMKEIWIFIENASGASGKMPSPETTRMALDAASFAAGPLVKNGSITLTRATVRESVWAYETRARTTGGLVVTQNGVETLTAAELRKRLGQ